MPVNPAALGPTAQIIVPGHPAGPGGPPALTPDEDGWERALYLARREMERRAEASGSRPVLCLLVVLPHHRLQGAARPGLSSRRSSPISGIPEYESAIAVFHQRYSTNTLPSWPLAQPFRLLAHNGEINTLWGNRNAMTMRQPMLASPVWGEKIERLREVIRPGGSDSASLDNAMELLVRSGSDVVHASMMMIPQAWEKYSDLDARVKAFYEYHQCVLEPWDGPAALALHRWGSGRRRRGPQRAQALPVQGAGRRPGGGGLRGRAGRPGSARGGGVRQGRPRGSLVVDTRRGEVIRNLDAKREVAGPAAVRALGRALHGHAGPDPTRVPPTHTGDELLRLQRAFGYGAEDLRLVLEPMGSTGADPVWSMGDDTPIPPLSAVPQRLYAYFRQRFAQVTNPPIDSLRESMVMSLSMHLGRRGSPLLERPSYARMLRLEHPILLAEEMAALRNVAGFSTVTLDAVWNPAKGRAASSPRSPPCAAPRSVPRDVVRTSSSSAIAQPATVTRPFPCCWPLGRCAST